MKTIRFLGSFMVLLSIFLFFSSCKSEECDTLDNNDFEEIYKILTERNLNLLNCNFEYDAAKDWLFYSNSMGWNLVLDVKSAECTKNEIVNSVIFDFILFDAQNESKGKTKFILNEETYNDAGILLSFDDYFKDNWERFLPLFVENDVKATFFCFGSTARTAVFLKKAIESGMCVGYHSLHHDYQYWTENATEENLYLEAIEPLEDFKNKGILFSVFAFPGGKYKNWMIPILLNNYSFLRLFINVPYYYSKEEIYKIRVLYSQSIDNNKYLDDKDFEEKLKHNFLIAKMTNKILPITSHYFLDEGEHYYTNGEIYDNYTISKKRLKFIFKKKTVFLFKVIWL